MGRRTPAQLCCRCPAVTGPLLLSSGGGKELGTPRPSLTSAFPLHGLEPSPQASLPGALVCETPSDVPSDPDMRQRVLVPL